MKTIFSRFPQKPLAATLLTVGVAIARADSDSLRNELLSEYSLLSSSDIGSALSEYEAQCKAVDDEEIQKIAALPKVEWTDEDAELFWSRIVESASRTSTGPRWTDADGQTGEGLLEVFGTRYMPNAYALYQETRTAAKEREQLLAENFPNGRASDSTGGTLYDKVSKACVKSVAEMFRRHDELCHFFLLHRTGAVEDGILAELDREKIKVVLPEIGELPDDYSRTITSPSAQERDFAQKYLPETWAGYQRLETSFADGMKNYAEWRRDAILVDAIRSEVLLQPIRDTLDAICGQMNEIVQFVKEQKLLHAVGEVTADQLADVDNHRGNAIRTFEKTDSLSSGVKSVAETVELRVKDRRLAEKQRDYEGRVEEIHSEAVRSKISARQFAIDQCRDIARKKRDDSLSRLLQEKQKGPIPWLLASMIQIPDRKYYMGMFEVTQAQWEAVMGNNPSQFKGTDNPVDSVSWNDCQEFLRKLNSISEVRNSGFVFRLPKDAEWEYACRAGTTGKYCKFMNGTEITEDTLDRVAWYKDNSGGKPHPVGQKEPNAFGLYDIIGNVIEICHETIGEADYSAMGKFYQSNRFARGGDYATDSMRCESTRWRSGLQPDQDWSNQGFRLCAEKR